MFRYSSKFLGVRLINGGTETPSKVVGFSASSALASASAAETVTAATPRKGRNEDNRMTVVCETKRLFYGLAGGDGIGVRGHCRLSMRRRDRIGSLLRWHSGYGVEDTM